MIPDLVLVKQALLQIVLVMKDVKLLPWPTVRAALAMSMHDMEDGHLQWADATQ